MRTKKISLREAVPHLVRKYRTFSPIELKEKILSDYNKDMTPEAITMFFTRNPSIEAELRKEVVSEEVEQVEVSDSIFQNGTFEELPNVKKWITELTPRIAPKNLSQQVGQLKMVCQGRFYLKIGDRIPQYVPNWTLKHPDRLTLEQAKEFLAYVHKAKGGEIIKTHGFRAALRSFFYCRDGKEVRPQDISGEVGKLGDYSRIFVEKEVLDKILLWVKERDELVYVADRIGLITATRVQAMISETKKSNLWTQNGITYLHIIDKGFHRKGRQEWDKVIPNDLLKELNSAFEQYGDSPFKTTANFDTRVRDLNKEAYQIFLKDNPQALELALKEPFHFWRHMFAQHMLRITNWNYTIVAERGGWSDEKVIKKCYGAPPSNIGISAIEQLVSGQTLRVQEVTPTITA